MVPVGFGGGCDRYQVVFLGVGCHFFIFLCKGCDFIITIGFGKIFFFRIVFFFGRGNFL